MERCYLDSARHSCVLSVSLAVILLYVFTFRKMMAKVGSDFDILTTDYPLAKKSCYETSHCHSQALLVVAKQSVSSGFCLYKYGWKD